MSPTFSVLIPSYNHAKFLPTCIESVLAQTTGDWEVVLVDDGSSDDSIKIARSFADPRIQVHSNPENLGTYGTLNRALSLARGTYVAILDSDDAWLPEKLEAQREALNRSPEALVCYTLGSEVDESGSVLKGPEDVHSCWPTSETQSLLPYLLEENRVLASSAVFVRTAVAFHPDLRYSGDWVALLEACRRQCACVPRDLSRWRQHGSNTFRRSPGQVCEEIRVRRSILGSEHMWLGTGMPAHEIRSGLGRCARHLAALEVLCGSVASARRSALRGLKLAPGRRSLLRLAATMVPLAQARAKLWPGEPGMDPCPRFTEVRWSAQEPREPR